MKSIYALCALVFFASSAQSQVFKCQEGGKTIFSDRPCGESAKAVAVTPATGAYDKRKAAEANARLQSDVRAIEAGELERERAALARERAALRREAAAAAEPSSKDRCDQLREDHADAKEWAGKFVHPDNIARERRKAKEAADRSFFECGSGKGVSIFDREKGQ